MFFRKKRETRTYDRETQAPVIHASICTGEKVAGFRDLRTGRFTEIMLIRTPGDLEEFRRLYGIGEARSPRNTESGVSGNRTLRLFYKSLRRYTMSTS